ncbi:MAG TPA: hypothetical protein PLM07_09900 [Candidatus Rifleibacterium sp.]|nr:hypothetical protein [Candidatus Rifleibacterium sp.]HPT46200.1 hypothetical protein [Candidatus Rifleibacterium sp.]
MKKLVKKLVNVLLMLALIALSGCSIPGSTGTPVEDDSVTIRGTVNAPEVQAPGMLAAIGDANSPTAFASFFASSSCRINGHAVAFSLSSATRELMIEKIPPAAAYNVELQCGNLALRSFAPGNGRNVSLPLGMSLRSTADWHLRDALASSANIAIDQLTDYSIKTTLVDALSASLQSELKKAGASSLSYKNLLKTGVSGAVAGKELAECLTRSGNAFVFNGTWSGKVYYYASNAAGKAVLAVQAVANLTCTQSGSTVSGSCSITPTAVVPLVEKPGISDPSKTAFAFSGAAAASYLTFVRKGSLGPLAGKTLDRWLVFPVRGGLAVKAENLDTSYFTGLTTRPGEFLLQKQ